MWWITIIVAIIGIYLFGKYREKKDTEEEKNPENRIERIEKGVSILKERVFELEHFDSPQFIDCQDAFDVTEVNYLRLKQRFIHTPEKVLEIAKDWHKYVEALGDLKFARAMLDVDMDDNAFDTLEKRIKEPSIITEEVEKKFKSLLGEDWQKTPPDYFERRETMKEPDKETKARLGLENEWKYYYQDSANLYKLEEKRRKQKKTRN